MIVDWELWLRNRPTDLRRADRVTYTTTGAGAWCQLCDRPVAGRREQHHREHMLELDAWLAARGPEQGPKPDSIRRSLARRERRQEALERTRMLGEDEFHHVVERVDAQTKHRLRRRRLRHPRAETLQRVQRLLAKGRMAEAIADELRISTDYTRQLIRELDRLGCSK